MSKKVNVSLVHGSVEGVWISRGDGDVHTYIDVATGRVVIGRNKSYKDKQDASETAIVFGPGDEVAVQVVQDGDVKFKKIDPDKLAELINRLLLEAADIAE